MFTNVTEALTCRVLLFKFSHCSCQVIFRDIWLNVFAPTDFKDNRVHVTPRLNVSELVRLLWLVLLSKLDLLRSIFALIHLE